jgi:CO/xanthine dehydrogenase Mo-binding subunit
MAIGQTQYRIDAPGKVTGITLYPGDIAPEDFLVAKVLFSNQPHARMVAMDTAAAEAVPGVVAVFTAQDVPVNEYGLTLYDQPVFIGLNSSGRSPIPADVSRWEGDHVALVVAETEEAAVRACELIRIEWEQLPLVPDVETALRAETLVHPENGEEDNVYCHYKIRKGDMAAGWAAADVVIEGTYELPHQEHAYLQPEAAVSYIDEAGRITVAIAGQWTHEDQEQIAHALDLPVDQIRVVYPAIGGAFGGREDMSLQIVLALATWKLRDRGVRRPLRAVWSREESIVGHHKRHRATIHTRWGATREGRITAVEADVYLDAGAYNYTSNKVLGNAHLSVAGPYEIANARIDSRAVYTTTVPGGAFRGFGAPQGAFVAENQMNKLAAALGLDPVAIRLQNCLREGSHGLTQTAMPAGVSLPEVIAECARKTGWRQDNGRWFPPDGPTSETPVFKSFQSLPPDEKALRFGRGIACAYKNVGFSFGFPERCEATIELHGGAEIERVVLHHAGADVGQGAHTVFRQMAAEAVGVELELVELRASDTAHSGDSGSASASRMTWMAGNAIRQAAGEALAKWRNEDRPARAHVRFTPPPTQAMDPETGESMPNFAYGYVAEAVELSVDVETGQIQVWRVVCANDVGKVINPQQVEGQIDGAVVQAYGYAVTEHLQLQDGRIRNPTLSTYLIPGILDIPERVEHAILEIPDPLGPWGARGMAEMPFIPLAPAITAALYEATGVWFDRLPLTPDYVVAELRRHAAG